MKLPHHWGDVSGKLSENNSLLKNYPVPNVFTFGFFVPFCIVLGIKYQGA